jgi:hypothetical protein
MELPFIVAAALFAILLIGVHLLEKRARAARTLTESELLFLLARLTETSEFEQFQRAAADWNISKDQAETDFNHYLIQERLPHYVRDYLRKVQESNPNLANRQADFYTGVLVKPKENGS